jgi:urease accessory protein
MKLFTKILDASDRQQLQSAAVDSVELTYDDRKRARLKIETQKGFTAGIQIERGYILKHGSCLQSEDGELLEVYAKPESVSRASVADACLFAKACYHLGNRHVSLQIEDGLLLYQQDYVLDDMLLGLGIQVEHRQAMFEPESGAYRSTHEQHHEGEHQNHRHIVGHHAH